MRHLRLVVVSLIILLASSSTALAQSSGAAGDQYTSGSSPSVAAGVHDTADTVAGGTEAVNEALSGPKSPEPSGSPEKVAGLTELPDTGGAPPLVAVLGVLLATFGLLARRIAK